MSNSEKIWGNGTIFGKGHNLKNVLFNPAHLLSKKEDMLEIQIWQNFSDSFTRIFKCVLKEITGDAKRKK